MFLSSWYQLQMDCDSTEHSFLHELHSSATVRPQRHWTLLCDCCSVIYSSVKHSVCPSLLISGFSLTVPIMYTLLYCNLTLDLLHPTVFLINAPYSPLHLVLCFLTATYQVGNHDRPRISSSVGQIYIRVINMLLLTLPGTPTTYYGEEIGMENINVTQSQIQDPAGKYNLVSIVHTHTHKNPLNTQ